MELINCPDRVYPVGRLDKDSEGLLLFTNDGDFANILTHPSHSLTKTYRVSVTPIPDETTFDRLRNGVEIDGRLTAPCEIKSIDELDNKAVFTIILHEGRNREIRKMCEACGLTVTRLKRNVIGSLKIGNLRVGESRELTHDEVAALVADANPHRENKNGKKKR